MKKKFRDTAIAIAAMTAMLIMMLSINPRLRERASEVSSGITNQQWETGSSVVGHTVDSIVSVASGFAGDNVYMFAFLVAACVLFVMLLRT